MIHEWTKGPAPQTDVQVGQHTASPAMIARLTRFAFPFAEVFGVKRSPMCRGKVERSPMCRPNVSANF